MDRMTIIGKDGRIRYIIEGDNVIEVKECLHWFERQMWWYVLCNQFSISTFS